MSDLLRVYNDQAAIECCGYALDGEMLVFLDVVGYKTACKSIWASTVNNPRKTYRITGNIAVNGGEIKLTRYRAFWMELPEQSAHNLIICNTRMLDAAPNGVEAKNLGGKLAQPFYLATMGQKEHEDDMHARFVALLNQSLEIPIMPTWANWLWQAGIAAELISPLKNGGCVIDAWRVTPNADAWAEAVQTGVKTGGIQFQDDG